MKFARKHAANAYSLQMIMEEVEKMPVVYDKYEHCFTSLSSSLYPCKQSLLVFYRNQPVCLSIHMCCKRNFSLMDESV